jgi:tellurite resistance protein
MSERQSNLVKVREVLEDVPVYQTALSASERAPTGAEPPRPPSWLSAMVEAAYLVACADGAPSDEQRRDIAFGLQSLCDGKLNAQEIDLGIDRVLQAVHSEGASKLLHEIAALVSETALREAVFLVACAAAWGEAGMSERKSLAISALGHAFGFSEGKLQSLLARARQVF